MFNPVHAPYLEVKGGWYRFRLLNGCGARQLGLEVQTAGGARQNIVYQIGTEGGYISQRTQRSDIHMGPGERYDILVDFRGFAVGTKLYLRNVFNQAPNLSDIMEFRIVTGDAPSFTIPDSLVQYTFPNDPTVFRSMDLQPPGWRGFWSIGGQGYNPNVANLQVRQGTTEQWTFRAFGMHPHPMHLHLVQFHINGIAAGSLEDGWKDIVVVPGGGERSITAHFDGEPGIYMFHCHNLEHEDWDMMLQYEICDDSAEHPCDPSLLNSFT